MSIDKKDIQVYMEIIAELATLRKENKLLKEQIQDYKNLIEKLLIFKESTK